MINGLDRFRTHFSGYEDRYVIIGGTACYLGMEAAGLQFRSTNDIDIVLTIDKLDDDFLRAFHTFVAAGGYNAARKEANDDIYYRFDRPTDASYPKMLELFCRNPGLNLDGDARLTPLPWKSFDDTDANNNDIRSLSAILMDDEYYDFVHAGKTIIDGLSVLPATHLIPLKGRAWLDHVERTKAGMPADSRKTLKHRNDIFRLFRLLTPGEAVLLDGRVQEEMVMMLESLEKERVDLRQLELSNSLNEVVAELRRIYLSNQEVEDDLADFMGRI